MSEYAKYKIEKEVVSVDNGQTWTETGNQRHGEILGVFPTLADCEDTNCDLTKTELGMYSGMMPEYLCGDKTTVYNEWLPQGLVQEATFSGGLMGCNGYYDSAPAYLLDNTAVNCGTSTQIGSIKWTYREVGGVREKYYVIDWNSFDSGKGVVLGTKYNCCGCCYVGACVDILPQKLYPWVDNDNILMLKISHYKKQHCSEEWVLDSEELTNIILERWVVVGTDPSTGSRIWQHQIASSLYPPEVASAMTEHCQNVVSSWENVDDPIIESTYLEKWYDENTNIYNVAYLNCEEPIKIPRITISEWFDRESEENDELLGRIELIQNPNPSEAAVGGRIVNSKYFQYHYTAGTQSVQGVYQSFVNNVNLGTEEFPVIKSQSIDYSRYGEFEYNNIVDENDLNISTPITLKYWEAWISRTGDDGTSGITYNKVYSDKGGYITKIWSKDRDGNYLHYFEPTYYDYGWMPQEVKEQFDFGCLFDRATGINYDNGYDYIYKYHGNWYWDESASTNSATTMIVRNVSSFEPNNSMLDTLYLWSYYSEDNDGKTFNGVYVRSQSKISKLIVTDGFETLVSTNSNISLYKCAYSSNTINVVDFPSTVSSITYDYILGENVYIKNLKKIVFSSTTPPTITINQHWFWDMTQNGATLEPDFGIYVPNQSINAYYNVLPLYIRDYIRPMTEVDIDAKAKLTYSTNNSIYIKSDDTTVLKQSEVRGSGSYSNIIAAEVYNTQNTIGQSAFQSCSNMYSIYIPDTISTVEDNAFNGCNSLLSISFPSTFLNIGAGVFESTNPYPIVVNGNAYPSVITNSNMSGYTERVYANSDTFKIINKLTDNTYSVTVTSYTPTSIVSGDSGYYTVESIISCNVTSISQAAFTGKTYLTKVKYGYGTPKLTSIGNYAFSGCTALTSFDIPSGVTSLGSNLFSKCSSLTSVTIPYGVSEIPNAFVSECTSLRSVTIPNNIVSIGSGAFNKCGITSMTIPDSVTTLGYQSFQGCANLESFTFGNGVTTVEYGFFSGCTALSEVNLSSGITSLGSLIFRNCTSLTSFTIPSQVISIGDEVINTSGIQTLTINCTITGKTGHNVFYSTNLKTVNINSDSVYNGMFREMPVLETAIIGNTTQSINDNAFYRSNALKNVTIGSAVTSIGGNAFSYQSGRSSLETITCLATTPPSITYNTFGNLPTTCVIYVPATSVDTYKAAQYWSEQASKIQAIVE